MGVLKLLLIVFYVVFMVKGDEDELIGEILDLSWPYDDNTVFWPGVRRFEYTKKHAGPGADGSW